MWQFGQTAVQEIGRNSLAGFPLSETDLTLFITSAWTWNASFLSRDALFCWFGGVNAWIHGAHGGPFDESYAMQPITRPCRSQSANHAWDTNQKQALFKYTEENYTAVDSRSRKINRRNGGQCEFTRDTFVRVPAKIRHNQYVLYTLLRKNTHTLAHCE